MDYSLKLKNLHVKLRNVNDRFYEAIKQRDNQYKNETLSAMAEIIRMATEINLEEE